MDDAETIRISHANWLSEFTFCEPRDVSRTLQGRFVDGFFSSGWLQPLLVLGYKRELEATDLPKMDETREAGFLADKFEANFARRRKDVEEWNRGLNEGTYVPSSLQRMRWRALAALGIGRADGRREVGMAMALSDTFFWAFWSAGIYKIIGDVAQTTSPLVMRQIITLVQQSNAAKLAGEPLPGIGRGIGLAVGLFLMQVYVRIPPALHSGEADCDYRSSRRVMSVCQNNTFSRSGQVGVLARAALIAALCASSGDKGPVSLTDVAAEQIARRSG